MSRRELIPEFNKLLINLSSCTPTSEQAGFLKSIIENKLASFVELFLNFLESKDSSVRILELELINLQDIFAVLFHCKKVEEKKFLMLEKDVLTFRKVLMNYREVVVTKKTAKNSDKPVPYISHSSQQLSPLKKKIIGFIHKEGETLNNKVFDQFKEVSRRTLKRHLSDLIGLGYIDREPQGKKVYYKKPLGRLNELPQEAQS